MNLLILKKVFGDAFRLFTKHKVLVGILISIGVICGVILWNRDQEITYDVAKVQVRDLVQAVSVTGKVKPAEAVDLAFERGGRVSRIYANVGDSVKAGSFLVALENSELAAQILQAKAKIQELDPARVEQKGDVDLQKLYQQGNADSQEATIAAKSALLTLSDIQYVHFTGNNIESIRLADAKREAVFLLLGEEDAGRWLAEFISPLQGGAFGKIQASFQMLDSESSQEILEEAFGALQSVKKALDAVVVLSSFTEAQKSNLSAAKNSVSSSLSTLVQDIQGIAVQKVANENALQSAIAQFRSAEATLQELEAQNAKTILRAPLAGIVTKQEGSVGEIVSSGTAILSLMSESQFEIESYVPEADIAKISIGNEASLTLDAYGSSVLFRGRVVFIDPAETVIDGVSTYKTITHFVEKNDRIKSGMTANIDITGHTKERVLALPQRAVITHDGKKFVKILAQEKEKEVEVEIGFRGSDGYVEILRGLSEGDEAILFSEK